MNHSLSGSASAAAKKIEFPLAIKVIMIDLDGTLLNTADDLALSANLMLTEVSETVVLTIGSGFEAMAKLPLKTKRG